MSPRISPSIPLIYAYSNGIEAYKNRRRTHLSLLNRMSFIGDFSYTLYVIHFPILVFMTDTY